MDSGTGGARNRYVHSWHSCRPRRTRAPRTEHRLTPLPAYPRVVAWNLERVRPPWDPVRPALYDFITGHLDDSGSLGSDPPKLPDVAANAAQRQPGLSPEAADEPIDAGTSDEEIATEITGAVYRLAQRATSRRAAHLYKAVNRADILDHTLRAFPDIQNAGCDPATIAAIGRWLATRAPDRPPVTFGMVLLGMVQPTDTDVMLTLGAHHEFTYVASIAVHNSRLGEHGVFELAQRTRGLGRVHALERLAATADPDIKRWVLTEGFRDDAGADYLAMACAIAGDLAEALSADDVDDTLLESAGEMLAAILDGRLRPTEYPDLVTALTSYLGLISQRDGAMRDHNAVDAIRRYLDCGVDVDIDEEERVRLLEIASSVLEGPAFGDPNAPA